MDVQFLGKGQAPSDQEIEALTAVFHRLGFRSEVVQTQGDVNTKALLWAALIAALLSSQGGG